MDPLRPGDPRQVGSYRLTGRLGEVFLGVSPGGRKVAVKLIRAEHASSPRFRARFAREVQAAQRVGGFHTAPVVDPDTASPWLVTAYIPGPSLPGWSASGARWSRRRCASRGRGRRRAWPRSTPAGWCTGT